MLKKLMRLLKNNSGGQSSELPNDPFLIENQEWSDDYYTDKQIPGIVVDELEEIDTSPSREH